MQPDAQEPPSPCNFTHIPASSPFDLLTQTEDWQGGIDKMGPCSTQSQAALRAGVIADITQTTLSNHSGQAYKPHKTAPLLQFQNGLAKTWCSVHF